MTTTTLYSIEMAQELNFENQDLKTIQKMFCDATNSTTFLNSYTLLDVEEGKKKVYLNLLRKYNYKHKEAIQSFVELSSKRLIDELFSTSTNHDKGNRNTEMVGIKNIIKDPRKLNPNYFNETYRIISIDSMYREQLWYSNYEYDSKTSTNMTVTLNDKLDNVISLELTNINIPFTFYNIDKSYGNNYFYVEKSGNITKIEIPSGNYTNSLLITEINTQLQANNLNNIEFTYSEINHKVTITNNDSIASVTIIFYDHLDETVSFQPTSENTLSPDTQSKLNNNLGWILGFRNINYETLSVEYILNSNNTVISENICYIPYTKYFVVVLDDHNKNQTNKGLVQISQEKEFIKRPQYFKNIDNQLNCLTDASCQDFVNASNRELTQKQIYSALQINNYRTNFKNKNSTLDPAGVNNVFGIIPFENKSLVWGESMFTSDKNRFKRKYNGPVDITKLSIKLLDDKGNLINLNGSEWSMTLISTHMYQS